MKMFLHAWKGLFAADEYKSKCQAVSLKLPLALKMLGHLLHHFWLHRVMSDEDLPTPCKHADVGALQESEKKLLYGEINSIPAETGTGGQRQRLLLLQGGQESALAEKTSLFHIISRKERR